MIPNMILFPAFMILIINVVLSSNATSADSVTYVVHMDEKKMKAFAESLDSSTSWHQEIIDSITKSGPDFKTPAQLLYAHTTLFSGFSAKLTKQHYNYLQEIDGFLFASVDKLYTLHTTHSPQFLGLHEGQGLWSPGNLASDVIIGVVDTGIWPEHISFRDLGYPPVPSRWKGKCQAGTNFTASNCNRKLVGAAAFFKGYESENGRINGTTDYRSARDSIGHGTHTSSTAGGTNVVGANIFGRANGTAEGMRYTARIAAYKACYPSGCYASDILAAMEQAVIDGVDVLSLSLGPPVGEPYYDEVVDIGAFGAMKRGVIVSASAGNSGPGSYTVANSAPWLMTVAASSTDRSFQAHVHLGDGQNFTGASLWSGNPTKTFLPLVYNETGDAKFCANGSLSPSIVKGNIVICVRGGNARVAKGQVVKAAGGAGMILINDVSKGEEIIADVHVLPTLMLGFLEGSSVINYTQKTSRNPTAKLVFPGDVYGYRAPVMAAFSSRGPSLGDKCILKPDVTAPGVDILAAWPPIISPTGIESDKRRTLFNIISGTSMSCPHVSGLLALLKSLHANWTPAAIKSALMTTAYIRDNKNSPISDAALSGFEPAATPFAYGSGHVRPEKAADPGMIYDISARDYLIYLCGLNYNSTMIDVVAGQHFTCPTSSRSQPGNLNYPSFSVFLNTETTTITYKRTATNVGNGVITYSVKVLEPKGVSITVQPKVLKFRNVGEKLRYNVTFKVGKEIIPTKFSFGSLEWVSSDGKYSVRSPIAVTFMQ